MTLTETMTAPAGYMERLMAIGMQPGWAKREPQMWPVPRTTFVPAIWRYRDALDYLTEASSFVSPEFAERRNLILANPIPGNSYPSCKNLVAAYQLVLPGETARSHRHSPNALRLVLDAEPGIHTLVDGLRVDMAPGDVVLTPQWHWHGHANYSEAPALWIDVLDVPLVQGLENMFFEHHPDTLETMRGEAPDSPLRLKSAEAIPGARRDGRVPFGAGQMPTMELTMEYHAPGERNARPQSIENTIIAVVEGEIRLTTASLGASTLTRGDLAVVPSWHAFELAGTSNAGGVVLRITDAPVFAALGFHDVSSPR